MAYCCRHILGKKNHAFRILTIPHERRPYLLNMVPCKLGQCLGCPSSNDSRDVVPIPPFFQTRDHMKKTLIGASVWLMFACIQTARAETWSCDYSGNWTTYSPQNQGVFNWNVLWQSHRDASWKISGVYTDMYGNSILSGQCRDGNCNFTQTYQNGDLAGRVYYWRGNYSDQSTGTGKSVSQFQGTWGDSTRSTNGTWQAIANCSRN